MLTRRVLKTADTTATVLVRVRDDNVIDFLEEEAKRRNMTPTRLASELLIEKLQEEMRRQS